MEGTRIIFVCGSTGAGKTTYAIKLASYMKAIRFSVDEMMKTLFWEDMPAKPDLTWNLQRVVRCENLVMNLTTQLYKNGQNIVMDLGFSEMSQRNKFYDWAKKNCFAYELHFVDVPAKERWKRIEMRNAELDPYSVLISKETFDWMESYFQPPDQNELQQNSGKRIH